MTEPKIVVDRPVFIKGDEYRMDRFMAKIKLENCDSTKYRAFEHMLFVVFVAFRAKCPTFAYLYIICKSFIIIIVKNKTK
jgi:hypothetical protein